MKLTRTVIGSDRDKTRDYQQDAEVFDVTDRENWNQVIYGSRDCSGDEFVTRMIDSTKIWNTIANTVVIQIVVRQCWLGTV